MSAHISKLLIFGLFLMASCQSPKGKKEIPLEVSDILNNFQALPPETQKIALENGWTYFTYAFRFENFQTRLLTEFPSLNSFGKKATLLGKTPLDLRPIYKNESNPVALLLAIDLEMEILSRFHTNTQASPRCLEDFWSEWGLPVPRAQAATFNPPLRVPSQASALDAGEGVALNERTKRLALYLRQSLGLSADAKLKLLSFEDPNRAQFAVNNSEVYEIFNSTVDCKALAEKQFMIPQLGKLKCLQKQSSAWISVAAKESTVVSDNWASEVKQRCQRWVRPFSDQLRKDNFNSRNSPLGKAWSLYPRLRNFVLSEANRYEASFRQAL